MAPPIVDPLDLLSYRRAVADLYGEVRRRAPSHDTWRWWVDQRDRLLASHPASPFVAAEIPFQGLSYHAYDPALNLGAVTVDPAEPSMTTIGHSGDGTTPVRRVGTVAFHVAGTPCTLSVYWLDVYGGGVFVPLRDATNGHSTYGGGRYLLDTAKSADLGSGDGRLVIDLNFAYHPSCVHDPRWSCPLAPADERLPVAIPAGETLPDGTRPTQEGAWTSR